LVKKGGEKKGQRQASKSFLISILIKRKRHISFLFLLQGVERGRRSRHHNRKRRKRGMHCKTLAAKQICPMSIFCMTKTYYAIDTERRIARSIGEEDGVTVGAREELHEKTGGDSTDVR